MENKADNLRRLIAAQTGLEPAISEATILQVSHPDPDRDETVVVVWERKGDQMVFDSAHVRRPGRPNRKLRNASEAARLTVNWRRGMSSKTPFFKAS